MEHQHFLLALLTGVLQGVIEWLPVSSKTMNLLLLQASGIPVDQAYALGLIANFGSFFAALFYFRRDVWQMLRSLRHPFASTPDAQLLRFVLLATVATGLVGLPLYKLAKQTLSVAGGSVAMLMVGGLLLLTAVLAARKEQLAALKGSPSLTGVPKARDAFIVGACQGLAALPGISRSGVTVTPLLLMNYSAKDAIRFSFLLNVVALLGAGAVPLLADEGGTQAIATFGLSSVLLMLGAATIVSALTIDVVLRAAEKLKTSRITFVIAVITLVAAAIGLLAAT